MMKMCRGTYYSHCSLFRIVIAVCWFALSHSFYCTQQQASLSKFRKYLFSSPTQCRVVQSSSNPTHLHVKSTAAVDESTNTEQQPTHMRTGQIINATITGVKRTAFIAEDVRSGAEVYLPRYLTTPDIFEAVDKNIRSISITDDNIKIDDEKSRINISAQVKILKITPRLSGAIIGGEAVASYNKKVPSPDDAPAAIAVIEKVSLEQATATTVNPKKVVRARAAIVNLAETQTTKKGVSSVKSKKPSAKDSAALPRKKVLTPNEAKSGGVFSATVLSCNSFGLYLELEDYHRVRGVLPLNMLPAYVTKDRLSEYFPVKSSIPVHIDVFEKTEKTENVRFSLCMDEVLQEDISKLRKLPSDQWIHGTVQAATKFGLFVRPAGYAATGLVHASKIPLELINSLKRRIRRETAEAVDDNAAAVATAAVGSSRSTSADLNARWVSRSSQQLELSDIFQAGDVVKVRVLPTDSDSSSYSNSNSNSISNSISDSNGSSNSNIHSHNKATKSTDKLNFSMLLTETDTKPLLSAPTLFQRIQLSNTIVQQLYGDSQGRGRRGRGGRDGEREFQSNDESTNGRSFNSGRSGGRAGGRGRNPSIIRIGYGSSKEGNAPATGLDLLGVSIVQQAAVDRGRHLAEVEALTSRLLRAASADSRKESVTDGLQSVPLVCKDPLDTLVWWRGKRYRHTEADNTAPPTMTSASSSSGGSTPLMPRNTRRSSSRSTAADYSITEAAAEAAELTAVNTLLSISPEHQEEQHQEEQQHHQEMNEEDKEEAEHLQRRKNRRHEAHIRSSLRSSSGEPINMKPYEYLPLPLTSGVSGVPISTANINKVKLPFHLQMERLFMHENPQFRAGVWRRLYESHSYKNTTGVKERAAQRMQRRIRNDIGQLAGLGSIVTADPDGLGSFKQRLKIANNFGAFIPRETFPPTMRDKMDYYSEYDRIMGERDAKIRNSREFDEKEFQAMVQRMQRKTGFLPEIQRLKQQEQEQQQEEQEKREERRRKKVGRRKGTGKAVGTEEETHTISSSEETVVESSTAPMKLRGQVYSSDDRLTN